MEGQNPCLLDLPNEVSELVDCSETLKLTMKDLNSRPSLIPNPTTASIARSVTPISKLGLAYRTRSPAIGGIAGGSQAHTRVPPSLG